MRVVLWGLALAAGLFLFSCAILAFWWSLGPVPS